MKTAILTDFVSYDPAYSLCGVVRNQAKMLGEVYPPLVLVRKGWHEAPDEPSPFGASKVIEIDPGQVGQNVVNLTDRSDTEIGWLETQLVAALQGVDVVLTHDLIYQPNMWKYHVACQRIAKDHPELGWLHFIHSSTDLGTVGQMGRFAKECKMPMPRSRLVVFHGEEMNRKGQAFGYETDRIVLIPNPIDCAEGYHEVARTAIRSWRLWQASVLAVYPARLDRGKQIECAAEVMQSMRPDIDARLVVVDFHSTGGDKAEYRAQLKGRFGDAIYFTSDIPGCEYHVPHEAVMDLFDYADFFIHPSRSESDPLTLPEAMWKRNGLLLNFDLPLFRQYDGRALFGKFGSNVDVLSGGPGSTNVEYKDRAEYMAHLGRAVLYWLANNPILRNHQQVRQHRSLEAVARMHLLPAVEGLRADLEAKRGN